MTLMACEYPRPLPGDWRNRRACNNTDPGVFFPDKWDTDGRATAKAICAACPVRLECGEHAIVTNEKHGIWGGMGEAERRAERKARGLHKANAQERILAVVAEAGGTLRIARTDDLADRVDASCSVTHRAIRDLEAAGAVTTERESRPSGGRPAVVAIHLVAS